MVTPYSGIHLFPNDNYMHQENIDTPCSISISALSNNINIAACHYACVDAPTNREWISAHHRNMAAVLSASSHVVVGVE
jgi:hypothetical protein